MPNNNIDDTQEIKWENWDYERTDQDESLSDDESQATNNSRVNSYNNHNPEEKGDSLLSRFGKWAQENLPDWVYKGFWGVVHLIGKTVRMLVFGEESVTREAAQSFERAMEAERYKAEKDSRDKTKEKEAKEYAEETRKEADTSQKKERDSQQENDEQGSELLRSRIEKAASRAGYHIDKEFDSKNSEIIKLVKSFSNGTTKDCYIDLSELSDADDKQIEKALESAVKVAGAQRYLDNYGLIIAAVGDKNFIIERPGGVSFEFEIGMMKDKLSEAVKSFKEMEKKAPKHVQPVSDNMRVPVTAATLKDFIPDDGKTVKEPEQQVINSGITIPNINFMTSEEAAAQPYKEITHAGFSVSGPNDTGYVQVVDVNGSYYHFLESDYRLHDPDALKATFVALERTGIEYDGVCPEVPKDFHQIINIEIKDLLTANNLAMAADENSDSVHVFARNSEGDIDYGKSWTLSQSGLALGDATDLKKVIFEIDNMKMISSLNSADEDHVYASDLSAATKAIGIVAAMGYDSYQFADNDTVAVAEIELTEEKGIMYGVNSISVNNSNSLDSLSFDMNIEYNGAQAILDTKNYIESLNAVAKKFTFGEAQLETNAVFAFLKEPADVLDHCIAMTMISADDADADEVGFGTNETEFTDKDQTKEEETFDFEPFNLSDIEEAEI